MLNSAFFSVNLCPDIYMINALRPPHYGWGGRVLEIAKLLQFIRLHFPVYQGTLVLFDIFPAHNYSDSEQADATEQDCGRFGYSAHQVVVAASVGKMSNKIVAYT